MASAAPERRLAIDGCPYTRIEFQEWYGDAGERLWADAGPERLSSSDAPQLADRRTDGVTQPNRTVVDQPAQSARAAASSASSWLDARTVTRDAAQLPPGTTTRDAAVPPGTATRDAATQVSFSCPATPASSASSCLDAVTTTRDAATQASFSCLYAVHEKAHPAVCNSPASVSNIPPMQPLQGRTREEDQALMGMAIVQWRRLKSGVDAVWF